MGYFPSDIPFMSEEERKENGIRIQKDTKRPDLYIYKLDLNADVPVIEKFPAKIREGTYGDEVIHWIGPNDYKVWDSEFDIKMLGVVYEPLDNVVELIVKRDEASEIEAITMIEDYCCKKAACIRKKLDMFHRGIGAAIQFIVTKVKKSDHLFGLRATAVIIDDFDPPEIPPVGVDQAIPESEFDFAITNSTFAGPFEGEEDI